MIDIHLHLLPGVDDGPPDMDESLRMAQALVDDGVEAAVATPHVRRSEPTASPEDLAERTWRLQHALSRAGIPLEVASGAELDLMWAVEADDAQLMLASYGQLGKDLLIETPFTPLPPVFERLLESLAERGYRLTLAHPERNPSLQRDPIRLVPIVEAGVLLQVTSAAVLRKRGSNTSRTARRLLRAGLVHVVASDAHGPEGWRGPNLTVARAELKRLVPGWEDWLVDAAPGAVVQGQPLPERGRRAWLRQIWPAPSRRAH